ncbi:MAG: hypothetical protein L7F77_05795 [Candidatus Magnetominusculus sp. LBB02]|nr:hypothetical protein [Candidatus Magnetominusculus sp. LBB02]
MSAALPTEIHDLLEAKVGKEETRQVGKILTASLDAIEKKAEAVAVQKKAEIKEELTKELATKADIAELKGEIKELRAELKGEINELRAEMRGENKALRLEQKIIFLILASIILLTNPKALELIAKLFGLSK